MSGRKTNQDRPIEFTVTGTVGHVVPPALDNSHPRGGYFLLTYSGTAKVNGSDCSGTNVVSISMTPAFYEAHKEDLRAEEALLTVKGTIQQLQRRFGDYTFPIADLMADHVCPAG